MGALKILAATFASISLGLLLAALISDYWVVANDHTGLWSVCHRNACQSYGLNVQGYIHATRAFMLIGALAGAVSFFGLWGMVCRSVTTSTTIANIPAVASLLAGLCGVIAMATFTGTYNTYYAQGHYGWSFGVGWASVPLFLITGGLSFRDIAGTTM